MNTYVVGGQLWGASMVAAIDVGVKELPIIPFDGPAAVYFDDYISSYVPQFFNYDHLRNYLSSITAENTSKDEYQKSLIQNSKKLNISGLKFLYSSYSDFTTGSTGERKQCFRPSISIHFEFLRLRDLLDGVNCYFGGVNSRKIIYYSRYGKNSFRYDDYNGSRIIVRKFNYINIQDLFDYLGGERSGFILSGTPSSIVELLDLGVSEFKPELVLLAGEACPEEVRARIEEELGRSINSVVARECGLIGFECPSGGEYHFFDNNIQIRRSGSGSLHVRDPFNYCEPNTEFSLGDQVGYLEHKECVCGFSGLSAPYYKGRPYAKPYLLSDYPPP